MSNLHKKIKRTFSISKGLGDAGILAIGIGAILTIAGYALSFRVDN